MIFDFSKEVKSLGTKWNEIGFDPEKKNEHTIHMWGSKGSGKTKLAQEFVNSHANAFYISFDKLSEEDALESFRQVYIPHVDEVKGWKEAVDEFVRSRGNKAMLIIFEDEKNDAMRKCSTEFESWAFSKNYINLCQITHREWWYNSAFTMPVPNRTIPDFCKAFSDYSRQDAARLQALTGGNLHVAKELDENLSFEENVKLLLKPDSAFSQFLPMWLKECFRTPESYYPILKSIADGHHRLSEIAKDIEFPNNKCGKYLDALVEHDFVIADKPSGARTATYKLASSYIVAWCRYVYGKQIMQVQAPDSLFEYAMQDMDEAVAIPALHEACLRYLEFSDEYYLRDYITPDASSIKKAVQVKLKDGTKVLLDYCVLNGGQSLYCVFPHSLDQHFTKADVDAVKQAIEKIDDIYNTDIVFFSLERYSDWCVHQSAIDEWLHFVTVAGLKY